jgi:hypothetical protein
MYGGFAAFGGSNAVNYELQTREQENRQRLSTLKIRVKRRLNI